MLNVCGEKMKKTFNERFKQICQDDPLKEIFVFYDDRLNKMSFGAWELYTLACRFAHILHDQGLRHGQVVACSLPLSLELAVCNIGILLAGGVVVNVEVTEDGAHFFQHVINTSMAEFLILRREGGDLTWSEVQKYSQGFERGSLVGQVKSSETPTLKKLFVISRYSTEYGQNFLEMLKSYPKSYVDTDVTEMDMATVLSTSGTTGIPKLVMRTHRSYIEEVNSDGYIPGDVVSTKRLYITCPWSWIVGSLLDILDGYTRVQPDLWHTPADLARLSVGILKTDGARYAFFTPPDVAGIMKHWTDVDRKPLDVLLIAGYPLTRKLCEMFFEAAYLLVFRYGSSEAVSVSYRVLTQPSDYEDFNCGVLCKGTQVKVVGEDMKEMAPGTPGRLLFKLPGLFSGYMAQPYINTSVITEDGWFVCGDAGYLDEKGQLMVLQRYDHVIQHKGSTVYPAYIEKYIRDDPRVHSAVIVQVTSEKTEQIICACVVLVPGSSMTEEDVKRLVSEKGKDGTVTPDRVLFFDSIDVNQRGKLKVNSLVEEVKKRLTTQE